MLPKLHDDIFVILSEVGRGVPPIMVAVMTLLCLSFVLTWIKYNAERRAEGLGAKEEERKPLLCTFPMCGKQLDPQAKEEWVQDKFVDLYYCSKNCMKRSWRENNHQSIVHLLKKRKEQLDKEEESMQKGGGWLEELSDIIPNPKGFLGVDLQQVCDKVSFQVEIDAARMTARTFSTAYIKKFGTAVHQWTYQCYKASGKGCILIHLSEKAVEESGGAPISFVQRRILNRLNDRELNKMIAEYDPETQLVLYIMQRGVDKKNLVFPFCHTVYTMSAEGEKDREKDTSKTRQRGSKKSSKAKLAQHTETSIMEGSDEKKIN